MTSKQMQCLLSPVANLTQKKCVINTCSDHPNAMSHNASNTLKHSNTMKGKDTKQLPNPITNSNIIASPVEITCHRNVNNRCYNQNAHKR